MRQYIYVYHVRPGYVRPNVKRRRVILYRPNAVLFSMRYTLAVLLRPATYNPNNVRPGVVIARSEIFILPLPLDYYARRRGHAVLIRGSRITVEARGVNACDDTHQFTYTTVRPYIGHSIFYARHTGWIFTYYNLGHRQRRALIQFFHIGVRSM